MDNWTGMARDPFYNLDNIRSNSRTYFRTFLIDNKKVIPRHCAKWAIPVCKALRQLVTEMRLAIDLMNYNDWNEDILKDAFEVLRYSIYDFLKPLAMVLRAHCNQKKDDKYIDETRTGAPDSLETFGDVGDFCFSCVDDAEDAFTDFRYHLIQGRGEGDPYNFPHVNEAAELQRPEVENTLTGSPVADKVPAATFTELVLQNQIIRRQRSILTSLDKPDAATKCICMSFIHISLPKLILRKLCSCQNWKRRDSNILSLTGLEFHELW